MAGFLDRRINPNIIDLLLGNISFSKILLYNSLFNLDSLNSKENIGGIETFLPGLSSGQWLSIPFILIGIIMLYISNRKAI